MCAEEKQTHPRVGVGILIENEEGEILLGLRKGSHGSGEWSIPGGHLEFGETIFETAKRETKEETGLDVDTFELISVLDEMRYIESDGKHYINLGVRAVYKGGEPKVCEPEKCVEWKWFNMNDLPTDMFEASEGIITNYKAEKIYQPK